MFHYFSLQSPKKSNNDIESRIESKKQSEEAEGSTTHPS